MRPKRMPVVATAEFACDRNFYARDLENVLAALSASTFQRLITDVEGIWSKRMQVSSKMVAVHMPNKHSLA